MKTVVTMTFALMLLGNSAFVRARAADSSNKAELPLDQVISDFVLQDGALIDGIAELSSTPNLQVHIGFEEIIRERIMDPRDRSTRFSVHLVNQTVRQILDTLCQFDARYTWSTDGPSINV